MNTFSTSAALIEYTKVHGDELVRQAHLANGDATVHMGSQVAWLPALQQIAQTLVEPFLAWVYPAKSNATTYPTTRPAARPTTRPTTLSMNNG